jgi:gamma-glutamylcyclotransferase (GGCT)/AIG2-like uncharacterized protein YtfP
MFAIRISFVSINYLLLLLYLLYFMSDYLFVYGTLMQYSDRLEALRLRQKADFLGEACTPGLLYQIGWYPGLVVGNNPLQMVYGELYRVNDPELFSVLDRYEGVHEALPKPWEYRCEELNVFCQNVKYLARAYVYNWNTINYNLIESGRWLF